VWRAVGGRGGRGGGVREGGGGGGSHHLLVTLSTGVKACVKKALSATGVLTVECVRLIVTPFVCAWKCACVCVCVSVCVCVRE